MKYYKLLLSLTAAAFLFTASAPPPDEGMYPLSELKKLNLNEKGLKIPVSDIYDQEEGGLIDALVNIGGCTGSFVSPEGLIITNHHCVFGAVEEASTTEQNYLENGFIAADKGAEIPAQGLSIKIMESYEDVSGEILDAASRADGFTARTEAIENKIKEIISREKEKNPTLKAEVSEMFTGQSYVLFRYRTIKDVRLVFAPPRSIGEFGGESDNWVWPRHTGDFSFVRAYMAPDGSDAEYSEANVPYKPKKFLKVNPEGVNEEDFIFILGYPGRTFKNQPHQFVEFQQKYQLPYISELYDWIIDVHEAKGENDAEYALEISSSIKSLANTMKNYQGKLQGLERLNLVERKKEEDLRLKDFINSKPELKEKYGNVVEEIDAVYDEILERGRRNLFYAQLSRQVKLYRAAELILRLKSTEDGDEDRTKAYVENLYNDFYADVDKTILTKLLSDAAAFPEFKGYELMEKLNSGEQTVEKYVNSLYLKSLLTDKNKGMELFDMTLDEIKELSDPFIDFVIAMENMEAEQEKQEKEWEGRLNLLLAKYLDAKKEYLNKSFIPDANSTLRLTYGYVRGYSPADAVYYHPFTSLSGVIEKGGDKGDYQLLPKLRELHAKKDYGRFKSKSMNDVPVALLYNTDTSGGNSGSPILDAEGRLIGVNFDRAYGATINDYAWSEEYSRSIGVDIRYVLWVTEKVGEAGHILEEMGIN